MRFRRLNTEELFALETEFKQFLIIHELYDEEWRALVKESPEKADQFIALFSDVVLEKIYNELNYLVHFSNNLVSFFDVTGDPMIAYHIQSSGQILLENEQGLAKAVAYHQDELSFFKGQKKRTKSKAEEVWELIQKGSEKCDEAYFKSYTSALEAK